MVIAILGIITLIFLLVLGIWLMVDGIKEQEFILIVFGLLVVSVPVSIVGYGIYDTRQKSITTETVNQVIVKVEDKKYEEAYTSYIYTGKVTTPIYHEEQWKVTLADNDTTEIIDSKELYNVVNVGDKIKAYKYVWTYGSGKIYKKEIKINKE